MYGDRNDPHRRVNAALELTLPLLHKVVPTLWSCFSSIQSHTFGSDAHVLFSRSQHSDYNTLKSSISKGRDHTLYDTLNKRIPTPYGQAMRPQSRYSAPFSLDTAVTISHPLAADPARLKALLAQKLSNPELGYKSGVTLPSLSFLEQPPAIKKPAFARTNSDSVTKVCCCKAQLFLAKYNHRIPALYFFRSVHTGEMTSCHDVLWPRPCAHSLSHELWKAWASVALMPLCHRPSHRLNLCPARLTLAPFPPPPVLAASHVQSHAWGLSTPQSLGGPLLTLPCTLASHRICLVPLYQRPTLPI